MTGTAGLWLAVVLSGLYHGLNPGMGWPLAVSSALFDGKRRALVPALGALGLGHFAAMLLILLPLSAMMTVVIYEREIRLAAGALVIGMGIYLLITQSHPRFLARVPPSRLALWSFLVAIVHGAALMLVPIYLGLCAAEDLDAGHQAAYELMIRNFGLTLAVAMAHTGAMVASGGALAYAVHRWFGLNFLKKSWFDLETLWALTLILFGGLGVWSAF